MSSVRSPVFWVVVAGVLAVTFLLIRQRRRAGEWGFRDVLKHPEYWDEAATARDAGEREAEAATSWDQATVDRAVHTFVFEAKTSRDEWVLARTLRELGSRTHPALLRFLRDRSLTDRWVKPTGVDLLPETPFERACDLLRDSPPPEVVPLLVPFLQHADKDVRKDAALILGESGTADAAPHLRTALRDADEYVRSCAMMGLRSAIEGARLADACKGELFAEVQRLLEERSNAEDAGKLLLALDRPKGIESLTAPEILSPQNPTADQILSVLADSRVPVARGQLLAFVEQLPTGDIDFRQARAAGGALRLLGQLRNPDDLPRLQEALGHPNTYVAEGAAAGLLASHDLEDFAQRIRARAQNGGESALSPEQRWCDAVYMCDSEVRNGGLSQYFVNSSGDDWQEALLGFERIESKDYLELLRQGLAQFGPDGPSTDRRTRQEQLSRIIRRDEKAFYDLESRWYKSMELLDVLMSRFVIAHPEAFR